MRTRPVDFRRFIILMLLGLIMAAVCAAGNSYAAGDEQPTSQPPVRGVEIKGLNRIDEASIRPRLSQGVGVPLSTESVSSDIKALFDTGYFKDVKVDIEPFEGGVKVIYVVVEKPSIRAVGFAGNDNIEDSKLQEKLGVNAGSIADPVLISDGASKIRDMYETEGYPLATVVPVVSAAGADRVMLLYDIKEGPRVRIRHIRFEGNEHVSSGKLRGAMETSEWWFWNYVFSGGRYERSKMNYDEDAIRGEYLNRGYLKADVSAPRIEYSADKRYVDLVYKINEGKQYRISAITYEGNQIYTTEALKAMVKSKPGDVISRKTLSADLDALTSAYTDKGYAMASVVPDIKPDDEKLTASIAFVVHESDIFTMGRIDIRGNVNTRDKVIRREIRLLEGDTYNGAALKRSYDRLVNLNYFETVKFDPKPNPGTKTVDLDVDVKEKSTGSFSVGAGYSTVDKLVGTVDITEGNLFGRGQTVRAKAEVGSKLTTYELTFIEPWLFDKPISSTNTLYRTSYDYTNYTRQATGLFLGLGKQYTEFFSAGLGYRIEQLDITNVKHDSSEYLRSQEGKSVTSSINPYVAYNTLDNNLDPHSGTREKLSITYAGVGGDNYFLKIEPQAAIFFPLPLNTVFSLSANLGFDSGLFGHDVPLAERYQVGGVYTMRGFRYLGPRDSEGTYIGSKNQMIFSTEFTFPLSEAAKFRGVVFSDIGTAYDKTPDFRESAGIGVRWLSPIGPLRLEYGRNLSPRGSEAPGEWEFAVGAYF